MPTRTKGPLEFSNHTSLSPESPELDLLTLPSLEAHPAVQQAIRDKEPMAHRLAEIEEALLSNRKQMAFYAASGQSDPATAATLATAARERLQTLETEHHRLIGEIRIANQTIDDCREATRLEILPELRRLARPVLDRRLADLEVLGTVARLLGTKAPARPLRQALEAERRYLQELKDKLCEEDS